jgi:hypothetical protein
MAESSNDIGKQVTLVPVSPGSVTMLEGSAVTAIPMGGQPVGPQPLPILPGSWPSSNWSNPPVVMIPQQQPVILVVTDSKKEASPDKDKEKPHSRVFTRL